MSDSPADNSPPRIDFDLPPVREFNDRTTLWLLEDPLNLRDLLRIHRPELAEHLDFTQAQRINRSFIPADLQKEEADLIFRVPFLASSVEGEPPLAVWIYFLLEHQSRPDAMMTLRLLSYMLELWEIQRREWDDRNAPLSERRLTPVLPFVFYTGEDNWTQPLEFRNMFDIPPGFEPFIPHWETLFLNLRQTPPETLTAFINAIGWALRTLQAENFSYGEFEIVLRESIRELGALPEEQFGQWLRAAWYVLLLIKHRRPDDEDVPLTDILLEQTRQSKFFEREETEIMYTGADRLMEEGRREGRRAGREEGREEGAKTALRSFARQLLTQKFGALPETVVKALDEANVDALNKWGLAAASANTLAEVGIESVN